MECESWYRGVVRDSSQGVLSHPQGVHCIIHMYTSGAKGTELPDTSGISWSEIVMSLESVATQGPGEH